MAELKKTKWKTERFAPKGFGANDGKIRKAPVERTESPHYVFTFCRRGFPAS